MPVLTLDEINNSFPEKTYKLPVIHNPYWWTELDSITLPNPIRVEFNENIKENIPEDIKNNKGIYMFFLEPNHPFNPSIKHLVYVGRVREGSTNFSFFKRFNAYKNAIGNQNESRNKVLLTNLWPNRTFVYFYSLSNLRDNDIEKLEDLLIKKIVPPLNSKIGGKAGDTRNFYN